MIRVSSIFLLSLDLLTCLEVLLTVSARVGALNPTHNPAKTPNLVNSLNDGVIFLFFSRGYLVNTNENGYQERSHYSYFYAKGKEL